ncbi:uncharacterized protein [Odocoileus virginianus]|uniref:Uncharacterized protein isoform X2 n=1 Tax=Odocoileus virginianus TaxID=9874 RepID=A0ABM4HFV7_ODOVR
MCFHLSSRRTPTPTRDSPAKGTYAWAGVADRLHPHAQTSNLPLSADLGRHLFRMGQGLPHRPRDSSGSGRGLDDPSHSQIWVAKLLQSDNGPAFISQISQQVATALSIDWHLHIPYRAQSSGKVERVNGIIKTHLTKLASELRLSWVDLLPLALTRILTTPHSKTGLTPFELLYGRPYLLTYLPEGEAPPLAGYLPLFSLLRSLLREHADRVLPQPTDDEGQLSLWLREIS